MTIPVGTVRVSPDGVVALKQDTAFPSGLDWRTSRSVGASYSLRDLDVASWEEVYTPEPPVGTVMKKLFQSGGWMVAIRGVERWTYVGDKPYSSTGSYAPTGDGWEILS